MKKTCVILGLLILASCNQGGVDRESRYYGDYGNRGSYYDGYPRDGYYNSRPRDYYYNDYRYGRGSRGRGW